MNDTNTGTWYSALINTTNVFGTLAVSTGWWVYAQLITNPLRCFYFKGAWWGNAPLPEICFQMTNVESKWWAATEERMEECRQLTEREFESWDANIMVILHFTVLTFIVLQVMCHCCIVRPIITAVQRRDV